MANRIIDFNDIIINRGGIRWNQIANFEQGTTTPNPTGFDSLAGAGVGNLAVTAVAAIRGNFGVALTLVGVASDRYGVLSSLSNETTLSIQFYINTNDLAMGAGESFLILEGRGGGASARTFFIGITESGGNYLLQTAATNDAAGSNFLSNYTITLGDTLKVLFEWQVSSGANNGILRLTINDTFEDELTDIDNDTFDANLFRIGSQGIDVGTSGILYLDDISWINRLLT